MAEYVGLHDNGKSSVQGFMDLFSKLFSSGAAKSAASTYWQVTQRGAGANMSVDVAAGKGLIADTNFSYPCWSDATKNVTVTTSNPSNPRIDVVVAYVDHAVPTTSVTNNTGALKFKVVAGTAAASPTAPSAGTIQTSVGSGNPWIYLAQIAVAAAATTIVNANITDLRDDVAIPNASVTTPKIAPAAVTPDKLSTGAAKSEVTTSQATGSTSYVDLATVQSVTVTVGANGLLLVNWGCQMLNSGANGSYSAIALSGANSYSASDNDLIYISGSSGAAHGRSKLFTGLTPGSTTVTMKFKVDGGTGTFLRRSLVAVPL